MNRYFASCALAALGHMVSAGACVVCADQQPPAPGTILTVAGKGGQPGFSGDGGPATQARLSQPLDIAFDEAGDLFIDDTLNACIRRVGPDGTITTVVGAGGRPGFSGDGGPAAMARLQNPIGLAFDAAGAFFFTDADNLRVRKVDAARIISTVAGGGHPAAGLGDGGPATAARLVGPRGVTVGPDGSLFIADPGIVWPSGNRGTFSTDARVRKVDPSGTISTFAGGGHPADGRGDGEQATDAHLYGPIGVALDPAGNLYIADKLDNRIRRVSPDGKIATVAGGGNPTDGLGDGGLATAARLDGPARVIVDPGGNLFITENYGERIRKVSPAGIITTVAGTGQVGRTGDGGLATAASLDSPEGMSLDRAGNLLFTEVDRYSAYVSAAGVPVLANVGGGNNRVRQVIGVAVPR